MFQLCVLDLKVTILEQCTCLKKTPIREHGVKDLVLSLIKLLMVHRQWPLMGMCWWWVPKMIKMSS